MENGRNARKIVRNLRICESVNDFHVFWAGGAGAWVGDGGAENARCAWKIVQKRRICESGNEFHAFWAGGWVGWVSEWVQKTRDTHGKSCENAESAIGVSNFMRSGSKFG